jgi:hypothetical protein
LPSTGERVVTDGTDRLRDGVKVIVAGEGGQAGALGQGQSSGQRSGRSQNQSPPAGK